MSLDDRRSGADKPIHSLLDAVVSVVGELDLRATLQRIVHAATELAQARFGALGVLDQEGEGLAEFVTVGLTAEQIAAIGEQPRGRGVLGQLIVNPVPVRSDDLATLPGAAGFPPNHPTMTTFLGVPVRVGQRVFGNLYLTDKRLGAFTAEDEASVIALAATAGILIENARLYDDIARRQRWLEATTSMQRRLLGTLRASAALRMIAETAREVSAADVGGVILEQDDGRLTTEALVGPGSSAAGDVSRDDAVTAVIDGDQVVTMPEIVLGGSVLGTTVLTSFTGPAGASGILFVGRVHDADNGTTGLLPTRLDREAFSDFAQQASAALDRVQAREERTRGGRDRLPGSAPSELLDLVIQRLFAMAMSLRAVRGLERDCVAQQRMDAMIDDLDDTVRRVRAELARIGDEERATLPRAQRL